MYIDPQIVTSPKAKLSELKVIADFGADEYSVAIFNWEGNRVVGVRWNGGKDNPIGNPKSRGIPTWFVLPDAVAIPYLKSLLSIGLSNINVPIVESYLESKQ